MLIAGLVVATGRAATFPETAALPLRGHTQWLRLYGVRGARPVVVSSGDGGWVHLAPHVAETLGAMGFFVVGFDVKAYLSGFTATDGEVRRADVPGDYQSLLEFARRGSDRKPILIGVSEGAGLSVLAAASSPIKDAAAGVLALGLPDTNELGWRWKDSVIYLTHRVPNEPTFSAAAAAGGLAPLPLAAIHSTADAFVSVDEIHHVLNEASDPKRLWLIEAADHRFSNRLAELDRRILEAIAWIDGALQGAR